jgi:hypothetical protein
MQSTKSLALQFVLGTLGAFSFWLGILVFSFLIGGLLYAAKMEIGIFTVENFARITWYLGMPCGSLIGIMLTDKYIAKLPERNTVGIIIGYVFCFFGIMITGALLGGLLSIYMLWAPAIITCLALAGYYLGFSLKFLQKEKK